MTALAETSLADDVWMTTAQVVTYSKRSTVTVHRHAAAGTLRSASGGRGRRRLYRREWVDAWIERSPRLPTP
jgi:hypothetical protein